MQKIFYCLMLSCVLFSCSKNETPKEPTPELSLSTNRINLSGNKLIIDSFTVSYKGRWTVSIEPSNISWCSLSISSGMGTAKVFVMAELDNLTNGERTANIVVRAADNTSLTSSVSIIQKIYEPVPFNKVLGGSLMDMFEDVIVVPDGYIAAGYTESVNGDITTNKGNYDALVVKYDRAGNKVWQKTFGGSQRDYAFSLTAATDGGVVVAGYTGSNNGDVKLNRGINDAWVFKINASGDLMWEKTFGGSSLDYAYSISPVPSGGYVIVGQSVSIDGDIEGVPFKQSQDANPIAVKIDENGNKIWAKTIFTNHSEVFESVKVQPNGEIICLGSLVNIPNYPNEPVSAKGNSDYYICKLSPVGDLVWQKTFGGLDYDFGREVVLTSDGGILLSGSTISINNGDVTDNIGDQDGWIVKLSGNGDLLWRKSVGTIFEDGIYDAIEIGSDIVLAGYTVSATRYYKGWIAKIGSSGTLIYQKELGGAENEKIYGIANLGNGLFIGAGYSQSTNGDFAGNKGGRDAWLLSTME